MFSENSEVLKSSSSYMSTETKVIAVKVSQTLIHGTFQEERTAYLSYLLRLCDVCSKNDIDVSVQLCFSKEAKCS